MGDLMTEETDKLKANLEERIKAAMARYGQSGRRRPLLRRKNNFIRGGMGIIAETIPPRPTSPWKAT